jgi:predicted transcriptional regulator
MKLPSHTEFVEQVKKHLDKTGEKTSMFGRRVLGDSSAIDRLLDGTDPRLSTMLRIEKAMKEKSK